MFFYWFRHTFWNSISVLPDNIYIVHLNQLRVLPYQLLEAVQPVPEDPVPRWRHPRWNHLPWHKHPTGWCWSSPRTLFLPCLCHGRWDVHEADECVQCNPTVEDTVTFTLLLVVETDTVLILMKLTGINSCRFHLI